MTAPAAAVSLPAVPDDDERVDRLWTAVDQEFLANFLLLLPHGQRVVLEVDGTQHFTGPDGRPDAARYAEGVRGDRELKLSGYEVFRFGATELQDREQTRNLLR